MGMRGIDVQVAIQSATEAAKIQQGDQSKARGGEAGTRETAEAERARRQAQSQRSERTDQVIIQHDNKGKDGSAGSPEENDENTDEALSGEQDEELKKHSNKDWLRKPRARGDLDILA